MKRYKPLQRVRKSLRRGEPSKAEKMAARAFCCERAHGLCEMPFPHPCPKYVPLELGQLAHLRGKRRFGWFESEKQKHLWSCAEGHRLQHCYGWTGIKPCPSKI